MKSLRAGLAVILLAGAASAARAQEAIYFHAYPDSAVGVAAGDTAALTVLYYSYYQLQHGRFRIHFDPAKVDVVGVVPGLLGAAVLTPVGPGVVQVAGNGSAYGYDQLLFRLRVVLTSGASEGSYLWITPDSVLTTSGSLGYRFGSGIGRVCHATARWGDLDLNGGIDSRDALITLSAAVGLPVTGFTLDRADVDGDAIASSRDALLMLSWSIGLTITATNRLGQAIPDACPGLSAPGEDLVFVGDTGLTGPQALRRLAATSTTPVTVPLPTTPASFMGEPRLAANGTSIVYSCSNVWPQLCRAQTDGTGFQQLTSGEVYARNPDWSPSGLEIAYSTQVPYTFRRMNADGTGDSTIASHGGPNPFIAWSRAGTQLAYSTSSGLFVVDRYGAGGTISISPATYISAYDVQRWSPAGDSIAFTTGYSPGIRAVPAAGGTSDSRVRFAYMGQIFDWGTPGFVFSYESNSPGFGGLWLMTPGGQLRRVTSGSNDHSPAFRRNP